MDENKKQMKKGPGPGKLVGIIILLLILLILNVPKLCFFLSPSQQEAVKLFNETYFGGFLPMRSATGGFDFMRLAALVLVILCCWAIYQIVYWIASRLKFKGNRAETVKGLVLNVIRYVLVIFAVIFGLGALGADVLTVIASLGILALIIGFGAQSLIEDMFAGFFILFEGRFYVGDIISVEGFRGTVKSIGIVSTQIEDAGGNIRIINNSNIRTMTNLSNAPSVAVTNVSIAYGADLRKAEDVIRSLCERLPGMYPELFPKPPRYMGVEELGESSVDLRVIADVDEANIYNARRALNRELKLALDEAGIEIPFPQVVVWQGK
ncbi:MAG: mechanosensitive ion channel family protein [Clostridia bacterium]|nr:mechanosensitive ion channel family protein [Clostridia bacterium]